MALNPTSKVAEVRVNKLAANVVGGLITVLLLIAGLGVAHVLPHHLPPAPWHLWALLVSIILLVPIHEAIHALGALRFAKVSWHDIHFGFMWQALVPYCHCTVPMTVRAYRRMGRGMSG